MGFQSVITKSDCLQAVQMVNNEVTSITVEGAIVDDIKALIPTTSSFSCPYSSRKDNYMVYVVLIMLFRWKLNRCGFVQSWPNMLLLLIN